MSEASELGNNGPRPNRLSKRSQVVAGTPSGHPGASVAFASTNSPLGNRIQREDVVRRNFPDQRHQYGRQNEWRIGRSSQAEDPRSARNIDEKSPQGRCFGDGFHQRQINGKSFNRKRGMTESEFLIQHAGIKLESHPFSFETPRRDHVEQGVRRRQGFENVVKKGVSGVGPVCPRSPRGGGGFSRSTQTAIPTRRNSTTIAVVARRVIAVGMRDENFGSAHDSGNCDKKERGAQ